MYIILLVSCLFVFSGSLAEFVITAHDRLEEQSKNATETNVYAFNVESFLKKYGYPFESHEVTTEDGYVLTLHRIPHGSNTSTSTFDDEQKPVALIMHGLGSSSADFFILGPNRSLAMMLADVGYDVWLGNNRGNTWSRNHTKLNPDQDRTFWDFSFHDLGMYDTPATIDYILNATQREQISYIGHSQGATQFFVLASELPEYNDKVNIFMALGPSVYCQNMSNPIVQIVKKYYTIFEFATNYLNLTEILGHSFLIETALKLICKDGAQYQEICPLVFFLTFGFDSDQFDRSMLTTILDVFPAGLATKELKHYLQLVKSGHFRQFDHGVLNNLEIYGHGAPPDYNITLVTSPVALYYGKNDWLVATTNVDQLADELPNVVEKYLISYDYFNHMDFLVAKDIASMLYFDLINKLNEVNGLDLLTSTSTTTITTAPSDPNDTTKSTGITDSSSETTTHSGSDYYNAVHSIIFITLAIRFCI